MNGARFLAEALAAHEVKHVFLVPAILRRALVEMEQLGIHRIVTHSEKAAAYMADGYARISRRPAVALAQSVGAANLAAGLQDAFLAGSPVIALTGRKPARFQHRNAYQEIDHGPMYGPVTKLNVRIDEAGQLPVMVRQLFRAATTGAPGPVHADLLGLSGELIEAGEVDSPVPAGGRFAGFPAFRPSGDPALVGEALECLYKAERPIIVAGGGAAASGANAELVRLAEMLSIPVATSMDGKGVIPENHPLSVGVAGSYSQRCANRCAGEADLVFFIGSATGDQVTLDWTLPGPGVQVIQIDVNPEELGRNYPWALGIHGDAGTVLRQMLEAAGPPRRRDAWTGRARSLVREWRGSCEAGLNSNAVPIRPERLCRGIADNLPAGAVLVADTGYSCVWAGTLIPITRPDQRFIRAAGSLGWAFPASLGAKLAAPESPVICFCGDGAFQYHLPELETARRRRINTVTILNNNHSFAQSVAGMMEAYGETPGNPDEVLRFEDINYARIAEDYGCFGVRVENPAEIDAAVASALKADLPAVIDVATDPGCLPPEIWRPGDR